MKKLVLLVCAFTIALNVNAQLETPQPSPASKIEQKVGLTDITIEYSRPGVKGRTIFGSLEPYGKVWRTGANANTTIRDIIVNYWAKHPAIVAKGWQNIQQKTK